MAGPSTKLGEAYIDVKVRTEEVAPAIDAVETKVEQATTKIGKHVDESFTKSIKGSISAVTSLVGAITSLVATFYVFERLGEKVGNLVTHFARAGDAAREFRQQARDMGSRELTKQMDDLNKSLEGARANLVNYFDRLTDAIGLTEAASVEAKTAALEEEAAEKRRLEAIKRRNELMREGIELQKEFLQTFQFSFEGEIASLPERLGPSYEEYNNAVMDYDRQAHDARIKQILEEGRERVAQHQRDAEAAAELAAKVRGELQKAFSAGSFEQSIAGPIEEMTRRLEARLDALKFGRGI